jgi:hypothetical protein
LEQGAKENNPQLVANPIDESDCQVGSNWPVGAMFFDFFYFLWCERNNPSSILEDFWS